MEDPPLRPPTHLLHIGPWASGISWRAVPNKGLKSSVNWPAEPVAAITDASSMSFTLNRDAPSEATIEFNCNRDCAIIPEEMVTDLWWRRHDHATGQTEAIGRFQARDVQVRRQEERIRIMAQWQDYRGVMEDRMIYASNQHPQGSGTAYVANVAKVTDILRDIFPTDTNIDLKALDTVNLGTIGYAMNTEMGEEIPTVIERIRSISSLWDWGVEMENDKPVLKLWPDPGRGTNRGATLVDTGVGWSPMKEWDRRTNGEDYANYVIVTGQTGSRASPANVGDIMIGAQGRHDYIERDDTLATMDLIQADADYIRIRHEQIKPSWVVQLQAGFWGGRSHIDIGDTVRVFVLLGEERYDDTLTVESINVAVQSDGTEEVSLTLGLRRSNPDPRSKASALAKIVKQLKKKK
jgi:hypothetical protein